MHQNVSESLLSDAGVVCEIKKLSFQRVD
jgi:hypothetical protein